MQILVIEDDLINQYVLSNLLVYLGYIVTTLDNAQDIFKEIKKTFFDLIFIDLRAAGLKTLVLEDFLKAKRPPIIAVGGVNRVDDYQKYIEMGLDDYLSLPISSKQLQLILRHWHFRNQYEHCILPLERFNTAEFLTRVGYNLAALQEMRTLFIEDGQRLLQQIHFSLLKKDIPQLKKATHELKGICSTLSTRKLKQLTLAIEKTAQPANIQEVYPLFEQLEQECRIIQLALNDFQEALLK